MKLIKCVLLVGVTLGLGACETAPVSGDSFDQDQSVAPTRSAHSLSLDPHSYMDDSNPSLQRMLSNFDRAP